MKKFVLVVIMMFTLSTISVANAASCRSSCSSYKKGTSTYERCIDNCEQQKARNARDRYERGKKKVKTWGKKTYDSSKRKWNNFSKGWKRK